MDPIALKKAFRFAVNASVILVCAPFNNGGHHHRFNRSSMLTMVFSQTLIGIIIVPLPLFFSQVIYGVRGLSAWVTIGIIWVFCGIFTVVFMPLWESRESLMAVFRGIVKVRNSTTLQGISAHTKTPLLA
jgi:hypothetical protein